MYASAAVCVSASSYLASLPESSKIEKARVSVRAIACTYTGFGRCEQRGMRGDEGTAAKRAPRHSPSQAANLSETSGFRTPLITIGHRLVYTLNRYAILIIKIFLLPTNEALRCLARARIIQPYTLVSTSVLLLKLLLNSILCVLSIQIFPSFY